VPTRPTPVPNVHAGMSMGGAATSAPSHVVLVALLI
jgi:hypothetical protein